MESNTNKKKILLIDDDEIHLTIAQKILESKYEVFTANSGNSAMLKMVKGFIPDLILLDILMPQMNGWETFKTIRGLTLLNDIPIAFLTSLTESSDVEQAQQMGAVDYIMKPYERESLLKRVEDIFNRV